MKKTTKRNRAAQDTTLINLRALKKRIVAHEARIKGLEQTLDWLLQVSATTEGKRLDKRKGRA